MKWFVVERAPFAKSGFTAAIYRDHLPLRLAHRNARLHGLVYLVRLDDDPRLDGLTLDQCKEEYATHGEVAVRNLPP